MDKYISIKVILDNLLDHPMLKDVTLERAINHTVNFMRIVGVPKMFQEKSAIVNIKEYRGMLPCDLYKIIQVRRYGCGTHNEVFRYSNDSFHLSDVKQNSYDLTYKLQNNIIFTSMKEGDIEIMYNAFVVDEDGYPMIPDDAAFINALELYIKKYYFGILFDLGKIQQGVLQNVQQQYAWAVGQATTSLLMPSIDEMESIANSINTLIPRVSEHSRGFINMGVKEKLRVQ